MGSYKLQATSVRLRLRRERSTELTPKLHATSYMPQALETRSLKPLLILSLSKG
jgi:hypothetical protein